MTREELIKKMEENSLLEKMRMFSPEDFLIHNAGLCLFGPWLLHLMTLAGYLDESKKAFKDLDSKIRAVFLRPLTRLRFVEVQTNTFAVVEKRHTSIMA